MTDVAVEVQVIPDPALSRFATAIRAYDFFHAYSDSRAVDAAGSRAYTELVRMGRTLPRGEVMALWELKCRREYGTEEHWRKIWPTDPVVGAMADFEADLNGVVQ